MNITRDTSVSSLINSFVVPLGMFSILSIQYTHAGPSLPVLCPHSSYQVHSVLHNPASSHKTTTRKTTGYRILEYC